jgi:cellulose synthase/poly-beta-1,6-N-acetylglucosamine synthase-like glycosyltransferase
MADFFRILFSILAGLALAQLLYPFVTVLLAQLLGKERVKEHVTLAETSLDYACIITAYRNAAIAKPLVESLLRQTHDQFLIYLVADECPEFDFDISDARFIPLRPDPPLRLKAKSIKYAISHFQRTPDYVVVFDADNLAHPQFLEEINRYAMSGLLCIQGQRTAKNLDTTYAALDSMGEHYKNYIERYVPWLLGGSSVISGSGMATETSLYNAYLASPEIEQGQHQWKKMLQEDKILQNFILRRGDTIAYACKALVYDEKVDSGAAVETQRSRWLFSYFQNLPNSAGLLWNGITRLNFNQLYFGWVTMALPMFIQVGFAGLLLLAGLLIAPFWSLALVLGLAIFSVNILLVLQLDRAPKPVWDAVWQVPKFVWRQFSGLFKMRDPNKHFQHTEHKKYVSVDEVVGRTEPPPTDPS